MQKLDLMLDGVHPKAKRGVKQICFCILDFVVLKEGAVSYKEMASYTGLKTFSKSVLADILAKMNQYEILKVGNGLIQGDKLELLKIIPQPKTLLPENYGKPFSETDTLMLCELRLQDIPLFVIAQRLKRTEKSIDMQSSIIRKAGKMIPWVNKHSAIREFATTHVSPYL